MEIQYVYLKTRSQFGKQCIFDDAAVTIEENIPPNPEMIGDYVYKNPIHSSTQNSKQFAVHEVQTMNKMTKQNGMCHTEGGWPKEVNIKDEEAVTRFRRRVEKDDNWAPKMRGLMKSTERCVLQNNALNIYENFFDDMVPTELVLPLSIRTINVYEDPQAFVRPITHLSWSPDHGKRLAVSYCSMEFQRMTSDLENPCSYIWDIENPNKPFMALKAAHPSVTIEFNPRDPSMLISGLMSGQVCNWDIRSGNTPVQVSHPQFSHRNPTNCALWINSKTNSEFFSASTGGVINWWDTRYIQKPTESLIMDLENPMRGDFVRAIGVSSLQYEQTMGTKFMAGMENGIVLSGNRKGKNAAEIMAMKFDCHYGPVISVNRNPFSLKNFLTIGDWTARIWAEDTKEGNLMSTRHHSSVLTGGCWSTSRYSVFYVINEEGMMEVFDILVGLNAPVTTIRLCENSLKAIAPHEAGKLVAVGNDRGKVYLVESSEALTTNAKNDKALLTACLERSSRYEKAVDNRLKERRVSARVSYNETPPLPLPKAKAKGSKGSPQTLKKEKKTDDKAKGDDKDRKKVKTIRSKNVWESLGDAELADTERQYFETIKQEMEKYAEVTTALGEISNPTFPTLAPTSREASPARRKTRNDLGADKGSSSLTRSKGRNLKSKVEKVGKTTRNEEIVIVMVDDTGKVLDKIEGEQAIKDKKSTETIEPSSSESEKKVVEIFSSRIDKPTSCDDEICDPKICCLDRTGLLVTCGDEDVETSTQDAEEHKMNAAISNMLGSLPKNVLPGLLEDLPCYTTDEKRQILAAKDASPSILSGAVEEARKGLQKWKKTLAPRKSVARMRKDEFNARGKGDKKQEVTRTLLMASDEAKGSRLADVRYPKARKTKRTRIEDCKKVATRFHSKEILNIIGQNIKVSDKTLSTKKQQLLRGKTNYPRISAVNISEKLMDDTE